jgi:hypothetical protein
LNSLALLVHGPAKVGKSRLANTSPAPRLILDAEGGSRFLDGAKVEWDPVQYAPPVVDGSWETCVVYVRDYYTIERVYEWLASGDHPFRSVIVDTISEIQQRCIDAIAGTNSMQQQDWGELLRKIAKLVRQFRDLTFHPTKPIECVVIVAMTREAKNGSMQPHMQGQIATTLPYYIDAVGYMTQDFDDAGQPRVCLYTSPTPMYAAGDRTGRLGSVIYNPTMPQIFAMIFGEWSAP